MQSVVRKQGHQEAQQCDLLIEEDVGRTFRRKIGVGDGVHIGAAADAVREKQYVRVTPWCDRKTARVVDADGLVGSVGQR